MKTTLLIAAFFISMTAAFATNGIDEPKSTTSTAMAPGAINKAQGAIRANCPEATGDLEYGVQTISACFVDGFVQRVDFYRVPNCPPGMICPLYVQWIGSVTLDCDNNVISIECGVSEI